jgi:hypothetical protein
MKNRFRVRSEDLQPLRVGPIGPHLESFAELLSQQGFCKAIGRWKIRLVAKLSRWLYRRHITLRDLDENATTAFLTTQRKCRAHGSGNRATMTLLLRHLRQAKVVITSPPAAARDDNALLAQDYKEFLLEERSLMPSTVEMYLAIVRRFLGYCFPTGKVYLAKLRARHITDFVLHDTASLGHRAVQSATSVLRSLLGFLFQKGRISINLGLAVPRVAG